MFADDCTLIFTNINSLITECNDDLALFKSWSDANRLTINTSKTNCLFISNRFYTPSPGCIQLDDHDLNFVSDSRFLGVVIDDHLKYNKHIQYICDKISKSIGIMSRIRHYVPLSCLRSLYFSIVHPYFLYCLPVFGATYPTHLKPLITLLKRAIRIISGAVFPAHTEPLFRSNKILKLMDLYDHSLGCYIYDNPNLLEDFARTHKYNTRNANQFRIPIDRLRSTEQSVLHNAIRVWNNIPADVKACRTKQSFKYQYKQVLLNSYSS